MSKAKKPEDNDEMREEYDFSKGVRGKYSSQYAGGSNVIVLDPDVAEFFGDSRAVNQALRVLADAARRKAKESVG